MRPLARLFVTGLLIVSATGDPASVSITVPAGGNLQQALNTARPGDSILLEPGAVYVGNFVLPRRFGEDPRPTILRTAGPDAVPAGQRMSPDAAMRLAKLQSPDNMPALRTDPGARFWRVELLQFLPNRNGLGDVIALGDGSGAQRTVADVPADLALDRIYVRGDSANGQKRAIALNSARTAITNSYIEEIKAVAQDSQAIAGWNGPGDYLIANNFLEAAGENIIFGGADPAIPNLVPTTIVIRGNTLSKPVAWRAPGSRWQVKNLLELKNARDVTIEDNLLERNWQAGQSGYAILFTVRNQDGGCRWCQVEDVRFQRNVVRNIAAGFAILGIDPNHPSGQTNGILIRNNIFDGLDSRAWGGDGSLLQLTDKPRDIIVDHNTIIQGTSNGVAKIDAHGVEGFVFTNNLASHGSYGIIAADRGVGNDSIRATLPGARITHNVLAGGAARLYPAGNFFPTVEEFRRQFVDFDRGDYRLSRSSAWVGGGTDGRDLGAEMTAMPSLPPIEPRTRVP